MSSPDDCSLETLQNIAEASYPLLGWILRKGGINTNVASWTVLHNEPNHYYFLHIIIIIISISIFCDSTNESSQEDTLQEAVLHCQVERLIYFFSLTEIIQFFILASFRVYERQFGWKSVSLCCFQHCYLCLFSNPLFVGVYIKHKFIPR